MEPQLIHLLDKNGYILVQRPEYLLIKKKVVQSSGVLLVFAVPGVLLIGFGLFFLAGIRGMGIIALILGTILLYTPFFGYISAPYRGLTINLKEKHLLFRSKLSRAYKFSEVESLELTVEESHSDTNPFSNSNKEHKYRLSIIFVGNNKEELFRFSEDQDIKSSVDKIRSRFSTLLGE